jgi:plastocyanin
MNRLLPVLGLGLLALVLAACTGGASAAAPSVSADPNAIQLSANNLKFSTPALNAPAGKTFQIQFNNQEGAPHNVAIYEDQSMSEKVFGQDPFGGPKTVTYQVGPLTAGSYVFRCDVHPEMRGTLTVH